MRPRCRNIHTFEESLGAYIICSVFPDFPRNLTKFERPDWQNEEVGLEMTGCHDSRHLLHSEKVRRGCRIREVVNMGTFDGGELIFTVPTIDGRCTIMFYHTDSRMIDFKKDGRQMNVRCESLTGQILKRVGDGTVTGWIGIWGPDDADAPMDMELRCFREKHSALQSYRRGLRCHLGIRSDLFFEPSSEQIKDLLDSMTDIQRNHGSRNYESVYVEGIDFVIRFDLIEGSYEIRKFGTDMMFGKKRLEIAERCERYTDLMNIVNGLTNR